jgi:hypothetical protein
MEILNRNAAQVLEAHEHIVAGDARWCLAHAQDALVTPISIPPRRMDRGTKGPVEIELRQLTSVEPPPYDDTLASTYIQAAWQACHAACVGLTAALYALSVSWHRTNIVVMNTGANWKIEAGAIPAGGMVLRGRVETVCAFRLDPASPLARLFGRDTRAVVSPPIVERPDWCSADGTCCCFVCGIPDEAADPRAFHSPEAVFAASDIPILAP